MHATPTATLAPHLGVLGVRVVQLQSWLLRYASTFTPPRKVRLGLAIRAPGAPLTWWQADDVAALDTLMAGTVDLAKAYPSFNGLAVFHTLIWQVRDGVGVVFYPQHGPHRLLFLFFFFFFFFFFLYFKQMVYCFRSPCTQCPLPRWVEFILRSCLAASPSLASMVCCT